MRSRRRRLVLVVAIAGALGIAATTVAQELMGADEFRMRLQSAAELAERGTSQPSEDLMADVRATLGLPVEVGVGEWTIALAADPVLDELEGTSGDDFERALARLGVLERSLDDAVAREAPDSARVADALADAYRGIAQPPPNLGELVLRAIGDVIGAILHRLGSILTGASGPVGWVVVIALAVAGLLLLRRADMVPDRTLPAGARSRDGSASVDWARRADEAIRAGDLREAVRALYLALLGNLAYRGLLADAPALTAGEARSAVRRARPSLFPAVARATESYERVVYGGDDPDERDIEHLRQAASLARTT